MSTSQQDECHARERQGITEIPAGMLILEAMNLRVRMSFL